jgi:hypothetical protein
MADSIIENISDIAAIVIIDILPVDAEVCYAQKDA